MNSASLLNVMSRVMGSRMARWLGLGISLGFILLICRALYLEREQLAEVKINRAFMLASTASIFVVVLGNLLGSIAAWLLLRKHSGTLTLPFSVALNGLAQMAKYLPGNVLHLVGRFFLIKHHTDTKTAFFFSIYEVLLLCLSGCSLGLLYVHYVQPDVWSLPVLGLLSLLLLAMGVIVLFRLRLLHASGLDMGIVVLLYLLSFLCYGQAFSLLFSLVFDLQTAGGLLCSVLFALAFVVGYVTPGASGGLGVREFVFMVLAQPILDPGQAVAVVVLFRLFSVAGDLVFALFALLIGKLYRVKLI